MELNSITNSKGISKGEIKVDLLRFKYLINSSLNSNNNYFLSMLIRTWAAEIEDSLSTIITRRQPYCILALEDDILLAYLIIKPSNTRGNCWSLSLPTIIKDSKYNTHRNIKLRLIRRAIELTNNNNNNCLLKYPNNCFEDLSIARELGFQPLKALKTWSIRHEQKDKISSMSSLKSSNQFNLLRVVDNERYPAYINLDGEVFYIKIYKK